jgi:hypothetical protein
MSVSPGRRKSSSTCNSLRPSRRVSLTFLGTDHVAAGGLQRGLLDAEILDRC